MKSHVVILAAAIGLNVLSVPIHADTFGSGTNEFTIDFVNVGNAGNFIDLSWSRLDLVYGGVAYDYQISAYEISQGMIGKAKALGLTNVTTGWFTDTQPAAYLSWYEIAAFVNWLNTSQGHHPAYNLVYDDGWKMNLWEPAEQASTGVRMGANPYQHKAAIYCLPSEDEWYKAAYHQNDGVTGHYWAYPTGSNEIPDGIDSGHDASYDAVFEDGYRQVAPQEIDDAGQSSSAYGTFGQGGNVWEVMESAFDGVNDDPSELRGLRGGSWLDDASFLHASSRSITTTSVGLGGKVGFRVTRVAAPTSNAPPAVECLETVVVGCEAYLLLNAAVADADGDPLVVVWSVNGVLVQTNLVHYPPIPPELDPIPLPSEDQLVARDLRSSQVSQSSFSLAVVDPQVPGPVPPPFPGGFARVVLRPIDFPLGTNVVTVAVSDGVNPPVECSSLVVVKDLTPPIITDVGATPSMLWPPNHRRVNVRVNAIVEDACTFATWKVFKIECDESHAADDLSFVDDHTVSLKATRSGNGVGRTYTLWIRATDQAGNQSLPVSLAVQVPHSPKRLFGSNLNSKRFRSLGQPSH